jgi:hypothetical protein
MSEKLHEGQRIHFVDDKRFTGEVAAVHELPGRTLYTVRWDGDDTTPTERYGRDELIAIEVAA